VAGPVPPFVVLAGEGEVIRGPVGGATTIKARAETTSGTVTAVETVVAPGQGPPLHVHVREDEMYYVQDGQLRFKADGRLFDAPKGAFMFIPRGTPHCFRNFGESPARILVIFTPAGMERFFEGHAKLPAGPIDAEAYNRVAHGAWMEVVGPTLDESDRPK
jgi:mannose-6-phosphate isomerase-like protein (cupin superfamily)